MIPLTELADSTARWQGVLGRKRHFRLTRDGRVLATLDWETASGSLVVARWAGGIAVIERSDFAAARVTLRDDPRGPELGTFVAGWREGGRLELRSGAVWTWRPESTSLSRWTFHDESNRPALETRVESMRLMPSGSVAVPAAAARLSELPLLVTLSWYLVVQTIDDGSWLSGVVPAGRRATDERARAVVGAPAGAFARSPLSSR